MLLIGSWPLFDEPCRINFAIRNADCILTFTLIHGDWYRIVLNANIVHTYIHRPTYNHSWVLITRTIVERKVRIWLWGAARSCSERMGQTDGQTDRTTDAVPLHRRCRILCEQCHPIIASLYLQAIETQNSLMVNLFNLFVNTVNLQPCFNFS